MKTKINYVTKRQDKRPGVKRRGALWFPEGIKREQMMLKSS
jgi:hypothetical protein